MPPLAPYTNNLLQALIFRTFALAQQPPVSSAASAISTNPIPPDTFTPTAQRPINNVLIIDDFTTDFDPGDGVFNHGERVEQTLLNRNPNLNVTRVNTPSDDNILDVVRDTTTQLVADARAGRPLPDAINLSIYSFSNNEDSNTIRENLRTLARAGVSVGIIAGKEVGDNGRPQLGGTPRQSTLVPFGEPGVIIADAAGERIPGATHTGEGRETSFGLPDALAQVSLQRANTAAGQAPTPTPVAQVPTAPAGQASNSVPTFADQMRQYLLNWLQQQLLSSYNVAP